MGKGERGRDSWEGRGRVGEAGGGWGLERRGGSGLGVGWGYSVEGEGMKGREGVGRGCVGRWVVIASGDCMSITMRGLSSCRIFLILTGAVS